MSTQSRKYLHTANGMMPTKRTVNSEITHYQADDYCLVSLALVGFLTLKRIKTMGILKYVTKAQVLGVVRHALTVVGGIAINKGWIDSESAVQLTGWLIAGVGVVWSILSKPVKEQP